MIIGVHVPTIPMIIEFRVFPNTLRVTDDEILYPVIYPIDCWLTKHKVYFQLTLIKDRIIS